jgi:hypothetical protein
VLLASSSSGEEGIQSTRHILHRVEGPRELKQAGKGGGGDTHYRI